MRSGKKFDVPELTEGVKARYFQDEVIVLATVGDRAIALRNGSGCPIISTIDNLTPITESDQEIANRVARTYDTVRNTEAVALAAIREYKKSIGVE